MANPHIGHDLCGPCHSNPIFKCKPCNHTTCSLHYYGADSDAMTCGTCGETILTFEEINTTTPFMRPVHPTDTTWTPRQRITNGTSTYGGGNASGPRLSLLQPQTPTRAPRMTGANTNGASSTGRYVPPFRRENATPARPESGMSTSSFASQPPSMYATQPDGHYTFGPSQLTQQMGAYDPFQGSPAPRRQGAGPQLQAHLNHARGIRPTNGHIIGGGPVNNYAQMYPAPPASVISSANDSAVAESHAQYLARVIRSGATDDPTDPTYGDPARVRRNMPPPRRGEVAAAAGHGNGASLRGGCQVANIDGVAAAFLGHRIVNLPAWFPQLPMGYITTFEDIIRALPLIEACRAGVPSTAGVVKIKNIPYVTSKAEIIAFLGRMAQICPQPPGTAFYSIHIIMHRQSGKTEDAYVEVETHKEATTIVNSVASRLRQGRTAKIGDRSVEVELSSQADLMKAMFPEAKNVTWRGAMPQISSDVEDLYPGVPASGFQGFLMPEELTHMIKHSDTPQRSPFAQRCLIRVYDCLISTLYKYPWYAVDTVFIDERNRLFKTVLECIAGLMTMLSKLQNNKQMDPTKPTPTTLKELAVAALVCPGFSEAQKATVVRLLVNRGFHQLGTPRGMNVHFGGKDLHSDTWPFQVLVKQPGVSDEFMEYFAAFLRDATINKTLTMADINAMRASGAPQGHFGFINVDYAGAKTIGEAGRAEMSKVKALLRTVLPPAGFVVGSVVGSVHGSVTDSRTSSYGSHK